MTIHHRYATIDGQRLFYREAGAPDAPAIVLLHGFPTSSYMFRDLIPRLAERYHVIAPDHLGYGHSDAPSVTEFDYTFDALADLTDGLLNQLGVSRYAIYVQDYGAPIGWRLALRHPEAITAIVSQNGNGYDEGFVESFWSGVWAYQREQTPETEAGVRTALSVDGIKWQYLTGVSDESLVTPTPGCTTRRWCPAPAMIWCSSSCSATTPPTPRCTRRCTNTCAPVRFPCSRCGVREIRSSVPTARGPSPRMPSTPRSTCSMAGTSCWKPTSTRSRA